MIDFGIVRPGTTLYIPFATYDSNDPSASVTMTGLATTDIEVYKNGGVTQRASDSGFALLDTDGTDFDGVTGIHGISIDLADNSDAGFYAAGAQYWVVIASVTVDAGTINFIAATFRIGYPAAILNTTIATLATQTSFTLTSGPAEDDALNGMEVVIHDVASAVQMGRAVISDYTGSTKTVTLAAGTTFPAAATDNISVMGPSPLQPTVIGRTLDVSAGGEAGVDWANVGSPTATVNLSGTNIKTDQKVDVETIKTQAVTCSGGVTIPAATLASTTNITGGTITTTTNLTNLPAIPTNWLTAAGINAGALNGKGDWVLSSVFTGITSLAQWLGLMAGKQSGNATARTELRATGAGSGTFDETTDSQEAIRDRGDAAWITATGFSTAAALATAQADLDTLTGADGVTLATSQVNYAPAKAGDQMDLVNAPNTTAVAAIADGILDRNMATGTDSGSTTVRTVRQALRALRNKWTNSGGTYTVFKEDDATSSWTSTVGTDAAAEPIVSSDPAGP